MVVTDGFGNIVLTGCDGEGVGVGDGGDGGVGKRDALSRSVDFSADFLERFRGTGLFQAVAEGAGFGQGDIFECGEKLVAGRGFIHSHD